MGPCYVGQYQNKPAVAVCQFEQTGKPVETWLSELAEQEAPVIAEIESDVAFAGVEYTIQLTLTQGTPPLIWSLLEGPDDAQVDYNGLVSGWTPAVSDIRSSFAFEASVSNGAGADTEDWPVEVLSRADFDRDGDVDQEDFGHFQVCLSGSGEPHADGCDDADLGGDGDVDEADFNLFRPCMGGADQDPAC